MTLTLWLALVLAACSGLTDESAPVEAAPPTFVLPQSLTDSPVAGGWVDLGNGMERREIPVGVPAAGVDERLIVFRLDPERLAFRVHYSPGMPLPISGWAFQLSGPPVLVFNGGFFDEDNFASALIVTDGVSSGHSYSGFGGMFGVRAGAPFVRSLGQEPWGPGEDLEQGIQGSPILFRQGGERYFSPNDSQRSRRTVIAEDAQGNIVLVVAPRYVLTLTEMARFLEASDLGLTVALNLDGGSSTGYRAGSLDWVENTTAVPAVVAVYLRLDGGG